MAKPKAEFFETKTGAGEVVRMPNGVFFFYSTGMKDTEEERLDDHRLLAEILSKWIEKHSELRILALTSCPGNEYDEPSLIVVTEKKSSHA